MRRKDYVGNTTCAYVLSFHQKIFSKSCENKTNAGQFNALKCFLDVRFCRIKVLIGKVDSEINTQMHTHTYQISYTPPALRAIVTSSFPYFSSADALQGQNHNRAEPHCNEVILLIRVHLIRNPWAHLIFSSSSMSLHVRRPSLSRWLIVS